MWSKLAPHIGETPNENDSRSGSRVSRPGRDLTLPGPHRKCLCRCCLLERVSFRLTEFSPTLPSLAALDPCVIPRQRLLRKAPRNALPGAPGEDSGARFAVAAGREARGASRHACMILTLRSGPKSSRFRFATCRHARLRTLATDANSVHRSLLPLTLSLQLLHRDRCSVIAMRQLTHAAAARRSQTCPYEHSRRICGSPRQCELSPSAAPVMASLKANLEKSMRARVQLLFADFEGI